MDIPGGINDRLPAKLNCIFKIWIPHENAVYRLAHISSTTIVGGRSIDNDEGMIRVRLSYPPKNKIVRIGDLRGMVHMIPVEPSGVWVINNRIDLYSWNLLYDSGDT